MTALTAAPADVAARHDLADGSTLWRLTSGEWLIDVPGFGRHQLVAPDAAAADTLARVQDERAGS